MLNRFTSFALKSEVFVGVAISSITLFYFFYRFNVNPTVGDAFYDADSERTLAYARDPKYAISSIRPLLYFVSWIPHIMSRIVSPYAAWTALNVASLAILIGLICRTICRTHVKLLHIVFLFVNFSVLSWTLVPDTFILGVSFFMIAITLYGDGSKHWKVIGSGIIASGVNIFLIIPWSIAHVFFGRRSAVRNITRLIAVGSIMMIMVLTMQYFNRFIPNLSTDTMSPNLLADPKKVSLPNMLPGEISSSISSLMFLHSPFLGSNKNLVMFLTTPWTFGYYYTFGSIFAINSVFFPAVVLILAIGLSLLSFLGIFHMRSDFPRFSVFCCSLEIGTCLLFLTYGFHPVLYSPFLLISRISGLAFYVFKNGKSFYPVFLVLNIITLTTIHLVF